MSEQLKHTASQFDSVIQNCRSVFEKKMQDYGAAWRILRPQSLTDQIYIKANRIRSIECSGVTKVDEGVESEWIGIVNYAMMGLIQLELGHAEEADLSTDEALKLYDKYIGATKSLMMDKNHDYGEAWRSMRNSSYTDLVLMKIHRTKQIEDNEGQTLISEGIDANYMDMANYAIFALIKHEEAEKKA